MPSHDPVGHGLTIPRRPSPDLRRARISPHRLQEATLDILGPVRPLGPLLARLLLSEASEDREPRSRRSPFRLYTVIALKQVLVATDFGEASDVALRYGSELARKFGANLHVVHVIEDYLSRANALPGVTESYIDWGRWQAESIAAAERDLTVLVSDDERVSGKATVAAFVSGSISRALIEYAREHKIDLIVAGTHGRGVVGHLVMGSVAERLVRYAPCPVLTVRHPEREFVMPDALQIMQAGS